MKIGILNADAVRPEFATEHGEYPDMFAEILLAVEPGLSLLTYEVVQGEYPADLNEVDAYIITGSKLSVYDDVPWVNELKAFVATIHKARKKLIGICFGHQMVAEALGGKTAPADSGWCVGVHAIKPTNDASIYGLPQSEIRLRANHQDQVTALPPGGKLLASTKACPIASIGLGDHILTFQAHPEFSEGYARALLDLRREIFGEETYHAAIGSLEMETDNLKIARCIVNFAFDLNR
jgi:GMP synthase-like glutamine amidotransferase